MFPKIFFIFVTILSFNFKILIYEKDIYLPVDIIIDVGGVYRNQCTAHC